MRLDRQERLPRAAEPMSRRNCRERIAVAAQVAVVRFKLRDRQKRSYRPARFLGQPLFEPSRKRSRVARVLQRTDAAPRPRVVNEPAEVKNSRRCRVFPIG